MLSHSKHDRISTNSRQGVSFVEFVGCFAALTTGVVFGLMYLGVDMQAVAVEILEKADLEVPAILQVNAETNRAASISAATAAGTVRNADDVATDRSTATRGALPETAAELGGETASDSFARQERTDSEKQAATQTCWLALDACIREEAANRSKSRGDPANWQLFDYLRHRQEGHEKAVEAIEQLDPHGIDQLLRAHVQQFLSWHRAGATLYERATQLLTNSPEGGLSGPFAQGWQSSATQHRMEEKLILNKNASIAKYLERASQ